MHFPFTDDTIVAEVPSDISVPEVCCVGLSSTAGLAIRNPSVRWLHVRIEIVSIQLDGQVQDPQRVLPFVMKEKCIIEPHGSETVKVGSGHTLFFLADNCCMHTFEYLCTGYV